MNYGVLQTQRLLSLSGLSPGPLDGLSGRRTTAASSEFDRRESRLVRQRGFSEALRFSVADKMALVPRLSITFVQGIAPSFNPAWISALNESLLSAAILDDRLAFYLAQLAYESDGFAVLEEYASGAAYEGRADLGNTEPGDGKRYKGRGPIQLTGRGNYRRYGAILGLPLEANPGIVSTPLIGFRCAAAYWTDRNLNAVSDRGDFTALTRRINGGLTGLSGRKTYYRRISAALEGAGIG